MNIQAFLALYAISVPVFVCLDLLWLGVIARPFYQSRLEPLLGDVVWGAAIVFYAIFTAGLTFFATYPAYERGSIFAALALGGLFGFVAYATYDLTNHATLEGWPLSVTVIDMLWGAVLGAAVSAASYGIYTKLVV